MKHLLFLLILLLFSVNSIAQNCMQPIIDWTIATKTHRKQLSDRIMTTEEEKKYGVFMHQDLKLQYAFVDKGEAYEELQALFKKLLPHTQRKDIDYQLFLYVDKGVMNVFSHIGGYIYVSYTAYKMWGTKDIMAFILAHEITHVENRHSVIKYNKIPNYALTPYYFLHHQVFKTTHTLFKQGEEYEADREGIILMKAAGFDPRNSIKFFYRMLVISSEPLDISLLPLLEMPTNTHRMCQQEVYLQSLGL